MKWNIFFKKHLRSYSTLLSILLFSAGYANATVVGEWTTIDDDSGKPKSIILIEKDGDTVKGTIQCLIKENVAKHHIDCEDHELKGQPIVGQTVLKGLKATSNGKKWDGGTIMDPKNCKVYKSYIMPKEDGNELTVRGYIGFALLGRTQTWRKTQASDKTNCIKDL